ncbi:hypothetical protein MOBT1_000624 [Malassezia obtusa]|uniref:Survival motor neuron Tudor domain-containing protein n=1 Tax=Malassezia obtusa TaxID=76774 RepID=A0AAF0DWP2_9BASI|nr:hypothetical protein MOBT1_000624 [Malassezia obtusa]
MRTRAVVSYEDLPHDAATLHHAAVDAAATTPAPKKRRRHEHEKRYRGPHWDEEADTAAKPMPAWTHAADDETYDSDDAMVASPTHDEPFVEEIELPGGNALRSQDVWDDRFLLDAWHAAEEEYAAFHQRRSDAIDALLAQEKDAHWYSLPTSEVQAAAPPSDHDDDDDKAGDDDDGDDDNDDDNDNDDSDDTPSATTAPKTVQSATDALPSTAHPTPGWIAAQQIVAETPNCIGDSPPAGGAPDAATLPSLALPASMPASETLQTLLMAWYYTGYYTALYQQEQDQGSLS